MHEEFKKVAVVSGHASGMGAAVARRLLNAGWHVVGVDIHTTSNNHSELREFTVDLASATDLDLLARQLAKMPRIDAVVAAAGIYPQTTLDSVDYETYRQIFDVNVFGTLGLLQAAKPKLAETSGMGHIVLFASIDGIRVSPGQLLYSASKAAVISLTRSLAVELAEDDVLVNAVAPGWVHTAGTGQNDRLSEGIASVPLKRAADPDEIAGWVMNLVAGTNTYMTGEILKITGGGAL
ncbi:SDR family NAD(P)-dependent oxidoreductase [Arthrobacter castelli]|uniref:SDR family NAD(P)-dependent oxidoreductase n=1 Tax=Arthrobacter castelli TaxID=271431 RepID=UPI00041465B4|nr:SDR family oxidoreductase [Arthrobacter castelli]